MSRWANEFAWLAGAVAGGATIGAVTGGARATPLLAGAFLGLLAFTLWRLIELRRLDRWLGHTPSRPPMLSGAIEDIGYRLWRRGRGARARTRRLARILRQLQSATHALPDAAVLLDGEEDIVWFNRAGARLLGLEGRDVGRGLSVLLRAPEIHDLLGGEIEDRAIEMTSPADERVTLDVRLIPYGEDRRLLLARDISQVAQLRTMRQDFIANVSHELRTPLTVMIGYLEALDGDTDPALTSATLSRLRRPASRMKTLVEDLLLLSRLDTAAPPDPESLAEIDVAALLRRICADASVLSGDRHRFETELDDALLLRGLDMELHSAFANMIVNAVRYSPDGGRITVRWAPDGDGARFSVRDEGLGIAEEHVPRLTERFYRVDVGRSREAGGTGLGLAIVKHVLRRHDSELEVVSQLGEGSKFSCRFGPDRVARDARRRRVDGATVA